MKKIPMFIFGFCLPFFLLAQKSALVEVQCSDYTCYLGKAQTALTNKQFKEAIDNCRSAKSYANANVSEADALIYKILESIVAQKNIAENEKQAALVAQKKAIEESNKSLDFLKKAKNDTDIASNKRSNAEATLKQVDLAETKAVEAIKKADLDIETAMRQKDKAKLEIAQAASTREKAKSAIAVADYDEKAALDIKKRAEMDTETARREKEKADDIIANSEKATLAANALVKEVSSALAGETPKADKPQEYIATKSVETPVKKETGATGGGIYINTTPATPSAAKTTNRKTDIVILQRAIDAEKNKAKAYAIQCKLIDSLENWFQKDTSYRSDLAENYANKAWSALFLRKYNESEQAARSGLATDNNKLFINAILGHALLFQGEYDKALNIYIDFIKDPKQLKNKSNRQLVIEDLDVLKQEGITNKDVIKIKEVLINDKKIK
jgi:hypothetical protein